MQLGPTSRIPPAAQTSDSSRWRAAPRRARLREPSPEDDECAHAVLPALACDGHDGGRRHGEHGELDRFRQVVERPDRRVSLHLVGVVVDQEQLPAEAGGEDVVDELARHRAAPARRAHDDDAGGPQQVPDAGHRRQALALQVALPRLRRGGGGNCTLIAPSRLTKVTGKPLSRNISIILWLSGRTSAMNVSMPAASASAARRASSSVPTPRPFASGATVNATSARSAASGAYIP
jgi:hypothetical protein